MCKCSFAAKKLQLFPLYEETSHIFQPLMSHFSFSYSLIDSLSSRDPLIKVTKLHQPFFESFDVLRHAFRRFKMQQIMMNSFLLGHKLWEIGYGAYTKLVSTSLSFACNTLHSVSFDWFLSGLEWILNLMFYLLKLLLFYY